MKYIRRPDITEAYTTPEEVYRSRRQFMKAGTALMAAGLSGGLLADQLSYSKAISEPYRASDDITPEHAATTYNNFYEFGMEKSDPVENSGDFVTAPWSVSVSGECNKSGMIGLEDLIDFNALEERIYRLRCVEAWSMVIPWVGVPLAKVLNRFEPTSDAKYVRFETVVRRNQMPGQRDRFAVIDWPYVEGLTIEEAMHPLTFLAVGAYGETLLPQNGAPLRLVVPWKYGFKSIKSIAAIKLSKRRPRTSWEAIAPNEYGFYANVNPDVSHPRWSQATERRLPGSIFSSSLIDTRLFNGYAGEVEGLYSGLDLRKNY